MTAQDSPYGDEEITFWIGKLKEGDQRAAQEIWAEYFERLVRLARARLGGIPRRAADEEDVALSAIDSFVRAAKAGRFPKLDDRSDLWKLLVTITARKAHAHRKREFRQKRGGGAIRGESVFCGPGDIDDRGGIGAVVGSTPTPEFAAQVSEEVQLLLGSLEDPTLREIALLKLEGYINREIAEKLDLSHRAVERKLALVRDTWSHLEQSPDQR